MAVIMTDIKQKLMPKAIVTPKAEASILGGHPWIYDAEIIHLVGRPADGDLVEAINREGRILGTGFINSHSKIRIRLLTHTAETVDEEFFRRKLTAAWNYRKTVMGGLGEDISACRIIFGEADGFPGLTVDRFSDILVTQTLSLGIEKRKKILFPLLREIMMADGQKINGIYERNDAAIRNLEGMEQGKGFFPLEGVPTPSSTRTEIIENGIRYYVDFENGQKTGFFLDQKYNRRAVAKISRGKRVLDCFTHTGSFALNAAMGGAAHVHAVDISEQAVEMARSNAQLNGLEDRMSFEARNVFDLLPSLSAEREDAYDFIILDPPAFTKSRQTVESAMRGYKEINLRAMRLLAHGGYLATCSCSHFMTEELFERMLSEAASDAGVSLRQIEMRQQGPDHPILWNVPETNYLKFYIFQVE